jgi:hypothetical protein
MYGPSEKLRLAILDPVHSARMCLVIGDFRTSHVKSVESWNLECPRKGIYSVVVMRQSLEHEINHLTVRYVNQSSRYGSNARASRTVGATSPTSLGLCIYAIFHS